MNNERHKNNALLSKYIWALKNDRKTPIIIRKIIQIGKAISLLKNDNKLIRKILFMINSKNSVSFSKNPPLHRPHQKKKTFLFNNFLNICLGHVKL